MIKLADLDVSLVGVGHLKTLSGWTVYRLTTEGRTSLAICKRQPDAETYAKTQAARQRLKYLGDLAATPLPSRRAK